MSLAYWGWAVLPAAVLAALVCDALAREYARRIARGEAIEGATLRAAAAAILWRRQTPPSSCRRRFRPLRSSALLGVSVLLLAALPAALEPSMRTLAAAVACTALLLLAFIDARTGLLPDAITLPLLWTGLLLAAAGQGPAPTDAIIGAAVGYGFLRGLNVLFSAVRGRDGLGGGDMKLLAALGAWSGWAALPSLLLWACVAGVAAAFLLRGVSAWRSALPFGPFLAAAGGFGLAGAPVVQFAF